MKLNLKTTLIISVWGFTALLFTLIVYINFTYSRDQEILELENNAKILAEYYGNRFEEVFSRASVIPEINAIRLETGFGENEESLKLYLQKVVKENKNIYGAAIAYEPYTFSRDIKHFAPYYYHSENDVKYSNLGSDDYDYLNKDWYRIPKEKGKPVWTEPYFDRGGGNTLMTTYSVPFSINGKFAGIATVDISLENLTDEINRVKTSETGYAFIVSKKGFFLSFPDQRQVLTGSIFSYDKDLGEKMVSGMSGFSKSPDMMRKENAWTVYHPIKTAGFSIGIVYPEEEILQNIYKLQEKSMFLGISGLVLLLLVIILIANSITRPLSSLVQGVETVASGNLDQKISVIKGTSEVISLEIAFNDMIDKLKTHIQHLEELTKAKEKLFVSSIIALANAIEARDEYTRGHSERVTDYSVMIAKKMDLPPEEIEKIRYSALLHDIGKIKIREDVLNKPGKLTEEEFSVMKEHPSQAAKILGPVEEFRNILPYLYHHHERYDGKGYPDGLAGKDIPIASRILAVADSFDAMTSNRPYRKAMPLELAVEQLKQGSGTQFDPVVTGRFLELIYEEKSWLNSVMKQ